MIKIDDLKALTKARVSLKVRKNVTVEIHPDLTAEIVIRNLEDYFGRREKQDVVRLVFKGEKSRYLLRTDFYNLVQTSSRGIGESDGGTLPGTPSVVKFRELCCKVPGCFEVLLVTHYDKDDPPACRSHPKSKMEPCNEARKSGRVRRKGTRTTF